MFLVYSVVYAGFVVIASVYPQFMAKHFGSVNWAVVYGFGLIGLALVMAVVYNKLCTDSEKRLGEVPEEEREG